MGVFSLCSQSVFCTIHLEMLTKNGGAKMKRKYYVVFFSGLLFLQVLIYQRRVSEQKKEVITPQAQVLENNNFKAHPVETNERSFDRNPVYEYYQENPDYVGWLTINDTAIDYPVVRGMDNEFYLNHNFYREEDLLGAIFMDYRNIGMGKDKHTVIYGHYSKHGQMFKDLDLYLSEDFLSSHLEFTLNDAFSKRTYKIFSVHHSYADPALINLTFEEDEFSTFTGTLKEQSLFPLETTVSATDQILTLVTCNYTVDNGRLFIHAVEQTE